MTKGRAGCRRRGSTMGNLYYGMNVAPIAMPDRVMAHLKVIIATKLRRGESFTITWEHGPTETPGRTTIWLQPSIPMRFVFDAAEPEALDREWLSHLAKSASNSGIHLA